MGRKKKIKEEPIIQAPEAVDSYAKICYRGDLTVTHFNGKRIISVKKYHNTGTLNMFRFICDALAGYMNNDLRPCKIALFTKTDDEDANNEETWNFNDNTKVTSYITYSSTAISSKVSELEAAVTYTFRIPYAYIAAEKIYKAGLFPLRQTSSGKESMNAYFGFVEKDPNNDKNLVWSEIDINNISATVASNSSLLIEWTVVVANQIVK